MKLSISSQLDERKLSTPLIVSTKNPSKMRVLPHQPKDMLLNNHVVA